MASKDAAGNGIGSLRSAWIHLVPSGIPAGRGNMSAPVIVPLNSEARSRP